MPFLEDVEIFKNEFALTGGFLTVKVICSCRKFGENRKKERTEFTYHSTTEKRQPLLSS